ncbi:MAG: hypothetical protein ACYTDY_09085 [Planctomycetota bacterium]|jgi:hypothetical protein
MTTYGMGFRIFHWTLLWASALALFAAFASSADAAELRDPSGRRWSVESPLKVAVSKIGRNREKQATTLVFGSPASLSSEYFGLFVERKGDVVLFEGTWSGDGRGRIVLQPFPGYVPTAVAELVEEAGLPAVEAADVEILKERFTAKFLVNRRGERLRVRFKVRFEVTGPGGVSRGRLALNLRYTQRFRGFPGYWRRVLAQSAISRDPRWPDPTLFESQILAGNDVQILSGALAVPGYDAYDETVDRLLARAGILGNIEFITVTRFPDSWGAIGGLAGHDILLLDGKYLDILREYANAQARFRLSFIPPLIDEIVENHNATLQPNPDGYVYRTSDLDDVERQRADRIFESLAGLIVYHEFGHYFLYHQLKRLRESASPLAFFNPLTRFAESQADIVAGILASKVGLDELLAQQAYDILGLYGNDRQNPALNIADILSPAFQQRDTGPYESLADRKILMRSGYYR